ncbi:UNVERIFIED_ORG: hypothetical protein J2X79_002972 [Arthrobacter globiformis]|nr:hypothetical protein [Arthrobacter globiformis]
MNGETRQDSNTSDMIFSVAHIIWHLSMYLVLEPGNITKQQLQLEARALPGPTALVRARSKVVPPSYVFRARGV